MLVNLAASTYANVAAIPNQKRTITLLTSDELKFDKSPNPKRDDAPNHMEACGFAVESLMHGGRDPGGELVGLGFVEGWP